METLKQSEADYRADKGLNQSLLKEFAKSPAHYLAAIKEHREPSKAMEMGTAFHAMWLEPDTFQARFAVAPNCDKRTKEGKLTYEAFSAANHNKTIISLETVGIISEMTVGCSRNTQAMELLNAGQKETSLFANLLGVQCKGRTDLLSTGDKPFIADVKTCQDASFLAFSRSVFNYGYHFQAAFYLDLLGANVPYYIIAVETQQPHNCAVYQLSAETISLGRYEYEQALLNFKTWSETPVTKRFNGYHKGARIIDLPNWMKV